MKELSIEDKAYNGNYKAYTELINRLEEVKEAIKKQNYGIAMDILCKPYPEFQITISTELKESEDERIVKELLTFFRESIHGGHILTNKEYDSWLAWLEKQGKNNMGISEATKQKLEDNLNKALEKETPESWNEFLDGQGEQKLVNTDLDELVIQLEETIGTSPHSRETIKDFFQRAVQKYINCLNIASREIENLVEENYRLKEKQGEQKPAANCLLSWSETDEKMLKSLEGIVKDYWAKAEQEKNEIKIREASNVSYFLKTIQKSPLCWIKCSDGLPNRDGIYLVVTDGLYNEVYDIARYDSIEGWHKASEIIYWMPIPQLNNKSIIEQKSVDKVEPKFKVGDIISNGISEVKIVSIDKNNYNVTNGEIENDAHAGNWVVYFKDQDNWKLKEQNPAWSEEDETTKNNISYIIRQYDKISKRENQPCYYIGDCLLWMQDIKNRVLPQPK